MYLKHGTHPDFRKDDLIIFRNWHGRMNVRYGRKMFHVLLCFSSAASSKFHRKWTMRRSVRSLHTGTPYRSWICWGQKLSCTLSSSKSLRGGFTVRFRARFRLMCWHFPTDVETQFSCIMSGDRFFCGTTSSRYQYHAFRPPAVKSQPKKIVKFPIN